MPISSFLSMTPLAVLLVLLSVAQGQVAYESVFTNNTMFGGTTFGNAVISGSVGAQFLSLTNSLANQAGAARINITAVVYPIISCRFYMAGGTGGQGISISYGNNVSPVVNATRVLPWAAGFGNNLIVGFRSSADAANSAGINVFVNGTDSSSSFFYNVQMIKGWVNATIQLSPPAFNLSLQNPRVDQALMSISYNGAWVVQNQTITNWNPTPSWGLLWSASTNFQAKDIHRVDNIRVSIQKPPVVTSVVVLYGDSVWPDNLWTDSTLAAALLTARGPAFSVKIGKVVIRAGTPRARRNLLQATVLKTYSIDVDFYSYNTTEGITLASNFAQSINNGSFTSAFIAAFTASAATTAVNVINTKYEATISGTAFSAPVPMIDSALYQPELADYLRVQNVDPSGVPPPASAASASAIASGSATVRRRLHQGGSHDSAKARQAQSVQGAKIEPRMPLRGQTSGHATR